MPFGLTNAPVAFMDLMNHVSMPMLDRSVIVFIDDILVYSKSRDLHKEHLREVLETLRRERLYAKFQVWVLVAWSAVSGVPCNQNGIQVEMRWEVPRSQSKIRSFLGFPGYYRRFIQYFSKIEVPLTRLTKKSATFCWGPKQQAVFETLWQRLYVTPILSLSEGFEDFLVYCDASVWHPQISRPEKTDLIYAF